jgi:hypothetical protein
MNKDLKQEGASQTYESEFDTSFDFVLREAGQLVV